MLGPADKSLYDVLGDAVNLASRMETICPGGGVCVAPGSADALKPWFRLQPLAEQEIKGIGRMTGLNVMGLCKIGEDPRRVEATSRFAAEHLPVIAEVEALKLDRLAIVDFISLQARDVGLLHNEAVAGYAVALLRALRSAGGAGAAWSDVDETALMMAALLHDVGKRAIDPARLNERDLDGAARDRLRGDLLDGTIRTLEQIGEASLVPVVTELYRFEATRGAGGRSGPRSRFWPRPTSTTR